MDVIKEDSAINSKSFASSMWDAGIKSSDQISPLMVKKMPRRWSFLLMLILGAAYAISMFYQAIDLYANCTQENNCISCALSLGETKGASCTPLAATDLRFAGGCASYSMPNQMSHIQPVLDGINKTIEELHTSKFITSELYDSFKRHGMILSAMQKNTQGQMTDPDPGKVIEFLRENYFGLSDVSIDLGDKPANYKLKPNETAAVISVGLKIIYSYISTGCSVFSAYELAEESEGEEDDDGFQGFEVIEYDPTTDEENPDAPFNATRFTICGCDLGCPRFTKAGGLEIDTTIGALDVSIDMEAVRNGLGEVELFLPNRYIHPAKAVRTNFQENVTDGPATAELVYISDNETRHCATNVFTSTPAQLNGVLFECCTEKTNMEKLSQISAFSGFTMTCTVLGTTILFWFCGGDKSALKDMFYEHASAQAQAKLNEADA
eukprot:TRINITY_DN7557_c0_g1_i2.p1 TRINITY_DN7557_c0_g1~~TRINITY_DN7557_c0_g1_i2.p1  ORF type:complete len:437 (+),score=102.13 TRINITY_DN7557_c0_g1_i2:240-1550(+)